MSSSKMTPKLKDQYHHVIPRFILREFKIGPKKTSLEREKEFHKTGSVDEKVWFYDIQMGVLEPRLISQVFGVKNLYRDVRNTKDVDEIEKKFAALESDAASILHNLHRVVQDDPVATASTNITPLTFCIIREDLDKLRKFLFLMHYRNEGHAKSYFSVSHPENADIRDRIVKMNKKLGFNINSPAEMWLHFMRYYLDTPHSEIGLHAFPVKESARLSGSDALKGSFTVNPDADNFEAMTYHTQASMYFLGIVQAAPGEEFALGHNTFGLWEGMVGGESGLHRLFVISPQVAIILRLNFFRPEELSTPRAWILRTLTKSSLLNIPLEPPESLSQRDYPRDAARILDFQKYKTSKQAKRDQFKFRVIRLTQEQTYAINAVVLLNARDSDGSITFANPDRMYSTLHMFWDDGDVNHRRERHKYEALIHRLSSMSASGPLQSNISTGDATTFYNRIGSQVVRLGASEPCPAEMHYQRIRALWELCVNLPSEEVKSHPFVSRFVVEYCLTRDLTIQLFTTSLLPPLSSKPRGTQPRPIGKKFKLVEIITNEDAKTLFIVMDRLLTKVGITTVPESGGPSSLYSATQLARPSLKKWEVNMAVLQEDLIIMGVLAWLVENRRDCVDDLLEGVRIYC